MSPFIAELLGTMVMILLGDGVVANVVLKKTKGFQAGWFLRFFSYFSVFSELSCFFVFKNQK